jgi:hypothetical protein
MLLVVVVVVVVVVAGLSAEGVFTVNVCIIFN